MFFSSLSRSLLDQCGGSGRPQDLGQLRAVAGIAWSDHPFTSCRGRVVSANERTTESIPATRTCQRGFEPCRRSCPSRFGTTTTSTTITNAQVTPHPGGNKHVRQLSQVRRHGAREASERCLAFWFSCCENHYLPIFEKIAFFFVVVRTMFHWDGSFCC